MSKRGLCKLIGGSVLGVLLSGCAMHTQATRPLDYPLPALHSAVEGALIMGIQRYSENRREIYSRPFQVTQSPKAKKEGYRERGLAKVTILGDRRPYTIEAEVSIEKGIPYGRNEYEYSVDRYDQRLAVKLLDNILYVLEKQTKDKNFIDDFRAF